MCLLIICDLQAVTRFDIQSQPDSPLESGWRAMDFDSALGRLLSGGDSGIQAQIIPAPGIVIGSRDRGATLNALGTGVDDMWRDLMLTSSDDISLTHRMDLVLSGLRPHTRYPISFWSFDRLTPSEQRFQWNDSRYAFNGASPRPQSLNDYIATSEIFTDHNGRAVVRVRALDTDSIIVLNGFEIGDPLNNLRGPTDIDLIGNIVYKSLPVGEIVGKFISSDPDFGERFTYSLAPGLGDTDNHLFRIQDNQLRKNSPVDSFGEGKNLSIRVRSTDSDGNILEQILEVAVLDSTDSALPLQLSEILAIGSDDFPDGDGRSSDWIEIYNPNPRNISLLGYYLTDDPADLAKWAFPDVEISRAGYLVVYASAPQAHGFPLSDYIDAGGNIHISFSLDSGGDFLAIVQPDGRTIDSMLTPEYPPQLENVSYGLVPGDGWYYLSTPTPGAENSTDVAIEGVVADTRFSFDRGFYDEAFELEITCDTPGATIVYTLDGTVPGIRNGEVYSEPIPVSGTTMVRAMAHREGWHPTDVDTHTYIFLEEVIRQPANPSGWPENWGYNSEVDNNDGNGNGIVPADYEMDPRVVDNTLPGYSVREALIDIPSVFITMNQDDFIKPGSGIYATPQSRIEKVCSVEYFDPDSGDEFQVDSKIEVHGNSSRRPWRMQKHSLRLSFTSDVGVPRLKFPLFPDSDVEEFNKLVLRACFTDSWGLVSWGESRYRPNDSQYIRDVWMKESFRDMGQPSSHGSFVHVYVNGLYFGLHNLTERLEEEFLRLHFGGEDGDWEINEDFSSPGIRWNRMLSVPVSESSGLTEISQYLDVENFIDYYILHLYADSEDWPHHNGYAAANVGSGDGRFRFFVWDQEIVLDKYTWNRYGHSGGVGALFQKLKRNADFRALFADRVQKHVRDSGGALSLAASQQRYARIAGMIDKAIVAESARWGDTQASTPYGNSVGQPSPLNNLDHDNYPPAPHAPDIYFTREDSWVIERDNIINHYLPTIHNESSSTGFINELRREGLFPLFEPPRFVSENGVFLNAGDTVMLESSNGTIYYTLDGTDPRMPAAPSDGGEIMVISDNSPARALIPSSAELGDTWTSPDFTPDSSWQSGRTGVGYEVTQADYNGLINLDVADMRGRNGSVYIRVPFQLDLPALEISGKRLILNMRYDDGFVAWLNGVRVASSNAPASTPAWNALATTSHSDSQARVFQPFDISDFRNLLRQGNNILAIQGLNQSLLSSDLLISPMLTIVESGDTRVSASARQYNAPVSLDVTTTMTARALNNSGEWSPLVTGSFIVARPASAGNITVSEIMYNADGQDRLEFIELLNTSSELVSLAGCRFDDGIEYIFDARHFIEPRGVFVLARSAFYFSQQFPDIPLAGEFLNDSALSNGGEILALVDAAGKDIFRFEYDDQLPWPESADGQGASLILENPFTMPDPGLPESWSASPAPGGSPGTLNDNGIPFPSNPLADLDRDGLTALMEYFLGTSDLDPHSGRSSIQTSIVNGPAGDGKNYFEIRLAYNSLASGIDVLVELSTDLTGWSSGPETVTQTIRDISDPAGGRSEMVFRSVDPIGDTSAMFARIIVRQIP